MISINGMQVGKEHYPNSETIFKSVDVDVNKPIQFVLKYESDLDIITLSIYAKYFEDKYPALDRVLYMLYIPYSRMDREIVGYVFSLKYYCKLINELNFSRVFVLDPHSNVSVAMLDRCTEISPQLNIDKVFDAEEIDCVFYPDNGALKRYSEAIQLCDSISVFYGSKKRNLQTGKIEKFEIVEAPDIRNKTVLIIDDLCAFGGTFIRSAKLLKEAGAKEVVLYVSHCENSIYKGDLLTTDYVDRIYTTDSILADFTNEKIHKVLEERGK